MKNALLITVTILCCTSGKTQPILVNDLSGSVGSWEGKLTYLDYSTAKPFTMPANLQIQITENKTGYIMDYEYPKEPYANIKDTMYIQDNFFGQESIVSFTKDSAGGFQLVTEQTGVDGNDHKKALLRHTYGLRANTYSIVKDVKFEGTAIWIRRNEYQFAKIHH